MSDFFFVPRLCVGTRRVSYWRVTVELLVSQNLKRQLLRLKTVSHYNQNQGTGLFITETASYFEDYQRQL